ncbi:hypothetical protein WH297_12970 [Ochrobactrum vermis]|uniref:Uncharacterized protein n=1 Tax=Ochrobactrum vermis TaxID=1827297 RepID=A0ABU8PEF6_9HYPH|nr:hypothetical protein [Ochrobactrum vermis]PQZ30940.1 hypothetical protein CQZ93_13175 [Ochrobactrum vermis]
MSLQQAIAAHKANMEVYHAIPNEAWDHVDKSFHDGIDATRQAVLDAICTSLEEVRIKAEFMLSCISFSEWGDLKEKELVAAFLPEVAR